MHWCLLEQRVESKSYLIIGEDVLAILVRCRLLAFDVKITRENGHDRSRVGTQEALTVIAPAMLHTKMPYAFGKTRCLALTKKLVSKNRLH